MTKQYIIGSRSFFKDLPEYKPADIDLLIVTDNPKGFKVNRCQSGAGKCIFEFKLMSAQEFIAYHLSLNFPLGVGKFLNPKFAKDIGLTIEQLKLLENDFNRLDNRHQYEKVIFEAYVENNAFRLTDEQLLKAFELYKSARGYK